MKEDILLMSMVEMVRNLKELLGERGLYAVLRFSGKRSSKGFFERLIGDFPQRIEAEEALKRSCQILVELGFFEDFKIKGDKVLLSGCIFSKELEGVENLSYYFVGLLEGLCEFMSKEEIKVFPLMCKESSIALSYAT